MNATITNLFNQISTVAPTSNALDLPEWSGFIFLIGCAFFWGSSNVPVKQFETGDGVFYQLIVCMSIWSVGFVVNAIRGFPNFYGLIKFNFNFCIKISFMRLLCSSFQTEINLK